MWGWVEYVPVATRRANAKRKVDQLRKKGKTIEPIEIEGRSIVKKFWGKKWCEHLETFSDFDNRLPRGRTYVRNGSICHLAITEGCVEALVNGSSLYKVKVNISTLEKDKWTSIKEKCCGQIDSLLELLSGKLSDHVMEVVADDKEGLFPNEGEIQFSCNCPDWADMCKHIAAVLYGIGNRLDEQPNLLFLLRNVDPSELITTKLTSFSGESDDTFSNKEISDIFDIDLDHSSELQSPQTNQQKSSASKTIDLSALNGKQLEEIRIKMMLTVREFAEELQVTPASVYRWENKEGILNLHNRTFNALATLFKENESTI